MKTMAAISAALFVIACCLPALEWKPDSGPAYVDNGLRTLALGWSGLFGNLLTWYANPLWLWALVLALQRRPWPSTIVALVGLLLALTMFSAVGRDMPGDEGNVTKTRIIALLPGAYVWLVGIGLPVFAVALAGK